MKLLLSNLIRSALLILFINSSCKKSDDGFVTYKFNSIDNTWIIYQVNQTIFFRKDTSRLGFIVFQQFEETLPGGPSCQFCGYTYNEKRNVTRLKALNDTAYFDIAITKTIPPDADPYHPPPSSQGFLNAHLSFLWKNPNSNFWYGNNPTFTGINQSSFVFSSITINGQLFDKVLKFEEPVFTGIGKIKEFYYDKIGGLLKFKTHDGE